MRSVDAIDKTGEGLLAQVVSLAELRERRLERLRNTGRIMTLLDCTNGDERRARVGLAIVGLTYEEVRKAHLVATVPQDELLFDIELVSRFARSIMRPDQVGPWLRQPLGTNDYSRLEYLADQAVSSDGWSSLFDDLLDAGCQEASFHIARTPSTLFRTGY